MKRLYRDAFDLLAGDLLGSGEYREVYACRIDPSLVVKVERHESRDRTFGNAHEWRFWEDHRDQHKVARWLAPCAMLSPDGRILLQTRVQPLPGDYTLPERLPHFLTDVKASNFGLLQGKLVCSDYEFTDMTASFKLRRAKWRHTKTS